MFRPNVGKSTLIKNIVRNAHVLTCPKYVMNVETALVNHAIMWVVIIFSAWSDAQFGGSTMDIDSRWYY